MLSFWTKQNYHPAEEGIDTEFSDTVAFAAFVLAYVSAGRAYSLLIEDVL
jgi:hypothetical protein